MLNKDYVIKYIEMNLGVPFQTLELTREEINEVINNYTLPIFSTYFPHTERLKVTKDDLLELGVYRINIEEPILGVTKFVPLNNYGSYNSSIYENPLSQTSNYLLQSDMRTGFAGVGGGRILNEFLADEISINKLPITYQFREPNIVEIYPKSYLHADWLCEMRMVHPSHLATIGLSQSEDFLKLCLYDIQNALYPIRARFQNLNTAYGSIELFMEGLQDAKNNRETLLDSFKSRFLKSGDRKKVFVY